MSLVAVDDRSNPFGQRAAARCRRCGLAIVGLVLVAGDFEHRDEATCAAAERVMQELGQELVFWRSSSRSTISKSSVP